MGKDFLKEIVEHKKEEVARAKRSTPIEKIREMALCGKENRPFFENLKNSEISFFKGGSNNASEHV